MTRNCIFYDGPSMLDRAPIFAALVGLDKPSANTATGAMLQVYIMRSDVSPVSAIATGADAAICGACKMRGRVVSLDTATHIAWGLDTSRRRALLQRIESARDHGESTLNIERACYVRTEQAPTVIFKAYRAGSYPNVTPGVAANRVRGGELRIGAYGDSAALPVRAVRPLAAAAEIVTNYTHGAGYVPGRAKRLAPFTMASADSPAEALRYQEQGFRTFRVSPDYTQRDDGTRLVMDLLRGERQCPKTLDKRVTCIDCGLCDGNRRGIAANIAAPAHGRGAAYL
jgi:hypothetical protein